MAVAFRQLCSCTPSLVDSLSFVTVQPRAISGPVHMRKGGAHILRHFLPSVSLALGARLFARASLLSGFARAHVVIFACSSSCPKGGRTGIFGPLEKHRRQKRQSKGAESLKPERESGRPAVRRAEPLRSLLAQHPRRPHTIRWDTIGRSRGGGPDGDGHGQGEIAVAAEGGSLRTRGRQRKGFVRSSGAKEGRRSLRSPSRVWLRSLCSACPSIK